MSGTVFAAAVRIICIPLLMIVCLSAASAQESGRKLALVIGNSKYLTAGVLPNAVRDAAAFHAFLTTNGFQSTLVLDGDRRALAEALSKFARDIQPRIRHSSISPATACRCRARTTCSARRRSSSASSTCRARRWR